MGPRACSWRGVQDRDGFDLDQRAGDREVRHLDERACRRIRARRLRDSPGSGGRGGAASGDRARGGRPLRQPGRRPRAAGRSAAGHHPGRHAPRGSGCGALVGCGRCRRSGRRIRARPRDRRPRAPRGARRSPGGGPEGARVRAGGDGLLVGESRGIRGRDAVDLSRRAVERHVLPAMRLLCRRRRGPDSRSTGCRREAHWAQNRCRACQSSSERLGQDPPGPAGCLRSSRRLACPPGQLTLTDRPVAEDRSIASISVWRCTARSKSTSKDAPPRRASAARA